MKKVLFAIAMLVATVAAHGQALTVANDRIAVAAPICFQSALSATSTSASSINTDVCIKRNAAGQLVFTANDLSTMATTGAVTALGTYQGTTSVGITNTSFTALVAAASDIPIPANFVIAKRKIRVHGSGVYTNAAASLLNAEVMLCQVSGCGSGTVVAPAGCAVTTTNQANNLTNGQFSIDCNLTATSTTGASGTFMAKALVCANLGSATSAVQSCFQDTATAVSAAVDQTVAEYVNVAFKFSTSNAGNSATLQELSVEVVD
jgi:hypothetical protein